MIEKQYAVGTFYSDGSHYNVITEERFKVLVKAKNILNLILNIEQKYDFITTNLYEFEQALLNFALKHALYSEVNYQSLQDIRSNTNRLIMNILTSVSLYKDTIPSTVYKLTGNEEHKNTINTYFAEEYDAKKEYQFMCYLRNYIQHQNSLMIDITLSKNWDNIDKKQLFTYISLYVNSDDIKVTNKTKSIIKDFLQQETKIDLANFTREYVQSISVVHIKIRSIVEKYVENARKEIELEYNKYINNFSKKPIGLQTCMMYGDQLAEICPLILDWDDTRKYLQSKNCILTALPKTVILSQPLIQENINKLKS